MPTYYPPKPAPGMYGDASSGNVVFDGAATILGLAPVANVYTLVTNINVGNMTVNSGVTIKCAGFILQVAGVLDNAGTIQTNGVDGSGSTAGIAIAATGTLQTVSGAGGAGRNTAGAGSNASGSGGRNVAGSQGGAGGTSGGPNAGGSGNSSAAPTAIQGNIRSLAMILRGRLFDNTSFNGSGGGGGGGSTPNAGTATSGGGGSGAAMMIIFCRALKNTGTISCNGGRGADAVVTVDGVAGGGGGGAGGAIAIVTEQVISIGTITCTGGSAGASAGTGAGNAASGTNGVALIFTPDGTTIL